MHNIYDNNGRKIGSIKSKQEELEEETNVLYVFVGAVGCLGVGIAILAPIVGVVAWYMIFTDDMFKPQRISAIVCGIAVVVFTLYYVIGKKKKFSFLRSIGVGCVAFIIPACIVDPIATSSLVEFVGNIIGAICLSLPITLFFFLFLKPKKK